MGWRKLLVVLLAIAVAAFINLNEHQATVLVAAIAAFNVGNAIEHLAGNKGVTNALAKVAAVGRRVGGDPGPVSGAPAPGTQDPDLRP